MYGDLLSIYSSDQIRGHLHLRSVVPCTEYEVGEKDSAWRRGGVLYGYGILSADNLVVSFAIGLACCRIIKLSGVWAGRCTLQEGERGDQNGRGVHKDFLKERASFRSTVGGRWRGRRRGRDATVSERSAVPCAPHRDFDRRFVLLRAAARVKCGTESTIQYCTSRLRSVCHLRYTND